MVMQIEMTATYRDKGCMQDEKSIRSRNAISHEAEIRKAKALLD